MDNFKPEVAIYIRCFLRVSMTFIYRQLMGVLDEFRPIVFTSKIENINKYPFDPVYIKERNFFEKLYELNKKFTDSFVALSPFQIKYFKKIIRNYDAKLIHAHFGYGGLDILSLAKALGIPLLVSFHGIDASALLKNKSYLYSLKKLFDYAHIIVVSKVMADRLISIGADPSRVEVLYYGIPLDDFYYKERVPLREKIRSEDTIEFLQVSNFVEKKGHKYTVMAFNELLSRYPNSRLTLAGDGPLKSNIEKLCDELGIVNKVSFIGKVFKNEVIDLMHCSDVFLHHSVTAENGDQEGIPNVLMEAMATGLPVISTYHSGIPELVRDGIDGYLVKEKDVKDYANKLRKLVESDMVYGKRGAERIKLHFNVKKQNKDLKNIYEKLIND